MSRTHDAEMFQSSIMSWSSKIMALGTVLNSQRSISGDHDSRYSHVYSSKSATTPSGIASVGASCPRVAASSRRRSIRRDVDGDDSSAYTWSPASSSNCGHVAGSSMRMRSPSARSASTPLPLASSSSREVNGGSCGAAARQLPNTSVTGPVPPVVRTRLGGEVASGSGHTVRWSSSTS
jgi:hypothetical protein